MFPDNDQTLLSADTKVLLSFTNNYVKKISTEFDKRIRGNFNSFQSLIFFLISTIGVPFKISNLDTSTKLSLTASTLSSEIAMGFGLIELRVVKTPRCFLTYHPSDEPSEYPALPHEAKKVQQWSGQRRFPQALPYIEKKPLWFTLC